MKLIEFANVSIGNPSNDVLLQSCENETITESTNSSIDSHSLESLMQSRGSETITESANASIVSKYYVSKNKTNITILLLTNQWFFSIINDFNH